MSEEVREAIRRWEETGLIPEELAGRLRSDVEAREGESGRDLSRYVLAVTAGVLTVLAAGVFLDWAWPRMTREVRSGVVAGAGIAVHLLGSRLEWRRRWLPASYLLQIAGLSLVLMALSYSRTAWPSGGSTAVVVTVLAILWVVVSSARAMLRGPVMPAVHLVFFLGYLAVALRRAFDLTPETVVWILDGVLLLQAAVLTLFLRRDPSGEAHPWVLTSFTTALYAGFVLVGVTGVGPLGLDLPGTILALDLWFLLVVAFTLWALHRAPAGLRSPWLPRQLTLLVLGWIPLGLLTAVETFDGPPELALLLVSGAGVMAFVHGDRHGLRGSMTAAGLAFVAGSWYWGMERAGALGAVGALAVAAGLLFWLSARWGGREDLRA